MHVYVRTRKYLEYMIFIAVYVCTNMHENMHESIYMHVNMYVCMYTYIQEGTIFMLICAHNVFQYTLYYMCVLLRKESAGPLFYPAATVAYL